MPIGRIGTDFIVNTTTTSDQLHPSVTGLADGRFVVTWRSSTGDGSGTCIFGRVYNADGSGAGGDFIVNSTTTANQGVPSVTALADGRFVVTWQDGADGSSFDTGDGSGSCIRGRVYNADGSAAGGDFIVNTTATNDQSNPAVTALADGRLVVTWQSFDPGDGSLSCIRGRVYNSDGTPAGGDFIVNTTATNDQSHPRVTALADGRFVVTWGSRDPGGSETCIRGRVFNADGSPAGADFIVNTTPPGFQLFSSVTALADGRFVVTWGSQDPGDGSGTCIRGRVFNADGSPTGADFIVNSTTTSNQSGSSVTALADGRFVVTWLSWDDIRARVYNVDGSPAGADFIVNTTNTLFFSPVTALADGRFVVTWQSTDPGDGSGTCIRAQIFDPTVFIGTANADIWQGGDFADTINGGGSGDTLSGLGGDDMINGDAANDSLDGGTGNDRLFGGNGNDMLNGGAGIDTMSGGMGNDTYFVDNAADKIVEVAGQGSDTVIASVSYVLAAGVSVETLRTAAPGATTAINLTGNQFANTVIGNAGNNVLNGGGGADTLQGLGGNDAYVVDNALDVIVEAAGQGTDNVNASVSYVLAAGISVETLRTINPAATTAINLTGNELANIVTGNAGANVLNGGAGNDKLTGYAGNDTFVFNTALNAATNVDTVVDFSVLADTIRLENSGIFTGLAAGVLNADAFHKGVAAADAEDRIIYNSATGALSFDSNGNTAGGVTKFAQLTAGLSLTNADFLVI